MTALSESYVLWGSHPDYLDGMALKVLVGSLSRCRAEQRYRQGLGWTELRIVHDVSVPARVAS